MVKEMRGRQKNRRRHKRQICKDQVVTLRSAVGTKIFVLLIDRSDGGIGCIYNGKNPPRIGYAYEVLEEGEVRGVEVAWVDEFGHLKHRLGLVYLEPAVEG